MTFSFTFINTLNSWADVGRENQPFATSLFVIALILILLLNIYWCALIIKMALKAVLSGAVEQDVREDVDD